MNPAHPTHYALTAVEGAREGAEEREGMEKVHSGTRKVHV